MARILREPLLHFALIGLALFALYGQVSPGDSDSKRIVVGARQVADVMQRYQALWGRAPTPAELRQLIETQVRDEIAYREGKALGLDRDDAVIKRRVRQKYDLIAEEESAGAAPDDAQLDTYRRANAARFTRPAVVSFEQLFFDPATSPARLEAVRAALARGGSPAGQGQPTMLPGRVGPAPLDLVARDFGAAFARSVEAAPVGQWSGPVTSGYGIHLVRVSAHAPAALPPLAQVRAAVQREWENDQRIRAREASYARARRDYDVTIAGEQLSAARP